MNIGDRVLYNGEPATVSNEVRPKCKCKGQGHYVITLDSDNTDHKVPLTTILESYKPLNMANQQIEPLRLV